MCLFLFAENIQSVLLQDLRPTIISFMLFLCFLSAESLLKSSTLKAHGSSFQTDAEPNSSSTADALPKTSSSLEWIRASGRGETSDCRNWISRRCLLKTEAWTKLREISVMEDIWKQKKEQSFTTFDYDGWSSTTEKKIMFI